MSYEIDYSEFDRLNDKYPSFFDTKGQKYLVLDGNILIVRPTSKEYGEKKEEIEAEIIKDVSAISSSPEN
jgi:hypothetical protein